MPVSPTSQAVLISAYGICAVTFCTQSQQQLISKVSFFPRHTYTHKENAVPPKPQPHKMRCVQQMTERTFIAQ